MRYFALTVAQIGGVLCGVKLSDADISICLALMAAAQGFGFGAAVVLAVAVTFLLGRLSR